MKKNVFKKAVFICCILLSLSFAFTINAAAAAPKFSVSVSDLKKVLENYSVSVTVNNAEQRFIINKKDISQIKINSKEYSANKKKISVKAAVYIDRKVAVVKANTKITYSLKQGRWKPVSVTFTKTSLSKINLKGTWTGTYVAAQGITRGKFVIKNVSKDGFATGIFYFSAYPTNPTVPSGSYTVIGGADKMTGEVVLSGESWINRPTSGNYSFVEMRGFIDLKSKKIIGTTYNFILKKK